MIYIIGIGGFIAKNFYIGLKKSNEHVSCLSHNDIDKLDNISNSDVVVNFCGINRGTLYEEYYDGNVLLVKKLVHKLEKLNIKPHMVHLSSLMVCGFAEKSIDDLPEYQKYFIRSKLEAEDFLRLNYPNNKLCIIRPSNIYGYDCEPYYNNIVVSIIHDKINCLDKINKINKNCIRNFLSVDSFCTELADMISHGKYGIFNLVSNNTIQLDYLVDILYENSPNNITVIDGEKSVSLIGIDNDDSIIIIINENIKDKLIEVEDKMKKFIKLKNSISVQKLNRLSQTRGDMVEISDLQSNRLYMITLAHHSVRGNHYHYEQIEDFYVSKGKVLVLLANKDDPDVIFIQKLETDMCIRVPPLIIHTFINDFLINPCEIFVTSTQKYISNCIPDTTYINLV